MYKHTPFAHTLEIHYFVYWFEFPGIFFVIQISFQLLISLIRESHLEIRILN